MPNDPHNSLKVISECPVCHKKHFPGVVKLIDENQETQLLHIVCKFCRSCLLVYVSLTEQGMNLVGVLTELESREVKKFYAKKPIAADAVIELSQLFADKTSVKKFIYS